MSKVTRGKCAEITQEFEPSTEARVRGHLGIDGTLNESIVPTGFHGKHRSPLGFTNYLLSSECDIFNSINRHVCQEMDHPLNHYFIASSHNTYVSEPSRIHLRRLFSVHTRFRHEQTENHMQHGSQPTSTLHPFPLIDTRRVILPVEVLICVDFHERAQAR